MFSAKVRDKLQWYVYAYIDPRTGKAFYIGQGKGNRAFDHLVDKTDCEKVRIIQELHAAGTKPIISILRHGLSQDEAKLVESVCIDFAELENLTNGVKGKYSKYFGRASVDELIRRYDAPPADVTERCIAINISQTYRPGMTDREIYECTRGVWPLGSDKNHADYALAVYQGVILEVYAIIGWFSAGSVFSERRFEPSGRYEFVGNVAHELSEKYKGKSLPNLFSSGKRFPIRYLNIKGGV
ncbi:hypothetical protein [Pseudomonas sp. NCCP-436]|uniref:LEM-3-like GIY-YIG domain-containing protein n=1 Tax=Pseudomonas sp. NCCP-436 TaxID=2842481 RepID=UPI001C81A723|nr:hypothetical protein [Pseudomonas sp. NCCP-436]GIZ13066.1 hypothetical protein NCCP436_24820 [Pseudomonas sp. NCCP-436]